MGIFFPGRLQNFLTTQSHVHSVQLSFFLCIFSNFFIDMHNTVWIKITMLSLKTHSENTIH